MQSRETLASLLTLSLFVAGCGGGGGGGGGGNTPTQPPPANNVVVVDMQDFRFVPKQITIQPGDTVRWVLSGANPDHTTESKEVRWDSGKIFLAGGDVFEHTFTAADDGMTFEYFCDTHTDTHGMKGSVRVGANAPDPEGGY